MIVDIYLDLSDLYHRVNRRFGRKINYATAMERFAELGEVRKAIAFGIQRGNEASGFITCLQRLGLQTRFKYPEIIKCGDREVKRSNWEAEISFEAAVSGGDVVVLGTGANNLATVAKYIVGSERKCLVFGCNIGKELRNAASEVIEITEDFLE